MVLSSRKSFPLLKLCPKVKIFAARIIAPTKKIVVRLEVLGWLARDRLFFLWRERNPKRLSNAPSDIILHLEDVFQFSVIAISPHGVAAPGLYQLGSDSQAIAGSSNAATQHIR